MMLERYEHVKLWEKRIKTTVIHSQKAYGMNNVT